MTKTPPSINDLEKRVSRIEKLLKKLGECELESMKTLIKLLDEK